VQLFNQIRKKLVIFVHFKGFDISQKPKSSTLTDFPVPVKTDVGQVDLALRLSDGTSEKSEIPKRAGTTDKSISTGIKYWNTGFVV
jgi:hypothetical protein